MLLFIVDMENLYAVGLLVIAASWLIQFFSSSAKHHEFNPLFLIFYALGTGILAWISYQSGSLITAILNLASFVLPIAVLLRISK